MEMVLEMPFFSLSNVDIKFEKRGLTWTKYRAAKVLPTSCRIKLIDKKEIAKAALDRNSKTFLIHVVVLKAKKLAGMTIYFFKASQMGQNNSTL